MEAIISMNELWKQIQALPLENKEWLSSKLVDDISREKEEDYISKEEILSGIDAGLKEMKLKKEGKLTSTSAWEFLQELRNEN